MFTSFADLLAPIGVDRFFAEHHRQKPLHIRGHAAKLKGVLSWAELSEILNRTGLWTARSVELAIGGQKVPPPEYCRPGLDRDGRDNMLAEMALVVEWLKRGASLIANDVGPLTPALRQVTQILEQAVGGKVQGNLYCSWKAHPGFAIHFDTHDVYALHLEGRKTWRIYQRRFIDPISHPAFKNLPQDYHNKNCGPVSAQVTLEPGDVLYIPRGYYHDALATSDATVHIAFGATPVIGLDVVSALFELAVNDPAFRAAVARETDAAALAAHIADLGDRLGKLARDPEFLRHFAQHMASHRYSRPPVDLPTDVLGAALMPAAE